MASRVKVGFFQTLEYTSTQGPILIQDELHGDYTITEAVLIELLHSPCLRRLSGVYQGGLSGFLGLTPPITRFEHSVGAFLIVRRVGGSLEEQVTALLHDVSHTVLSHVLDWAALSPPNESFHEVHKDRYIKTTPIPAILTKHGFVDLKPLQEELFPLVEMPSPHLCADRLDYGVRDSVAFGKVDLSAGQRILASIKAHPDPTAANRLLIATDKDLAYILCWGYLGSDRDVWSNPAHVEMSRSIADLIGSAVKSGRLEEKVLWTLSDEQFWEVLREASDLAGRDIMDRLKSGSSLPKEEGLGLHRAAKVRTLDPDVIDPDSGELVPLSQVSTVWAREKKEYILARQNLRV